MRTVCITLVCVLLATSLVVTKAAKPEEKAEEKSELASELDKLGIGEKVQQAVSGAFSQGGAQEDIPMPDPPASASSMSDDDLDDDDDSTDYLNMRDQKEIYEKDGAVERLTQNNFDEEVFNGKQDFTMIIFYSRWCKECQLNGASFRALGQRYRDDPKVKVFAVNQEGNYDISARFDTDPGESVIFYAKKNPQVDGDLKIYEGEVSFAALMQFVGSDGTDMVKAEEFKRDLYPEGETAVYTGLNWTNFNETVFNKSKNVMIQFYAGWSEFCQNDANNYTVLAAHLRVSNSHDAMVAAIDTDKHSKLADRFDVQGLPAYWFAAKNATEDAHLVKYTGDHNGALVIEEGVPFVTSGGTKVPPGMLDEHPVHPKPWEQTQKEMRERDEKEKEKQKKERKEQEEAAKERKEKIAKKKKALQEKKDKAEKEKAAGKKHDASEL